ncbi:PDZ domain-containing protein [Hylemonella gracilis]|uniref:PDZ domain-containing protein n=1 Tax=Hylemonella gracilis TaxID=80880 RepID=UPI0011103EB1|nr:PDZ domain-containing protein [Hylemonella gracilis]
MNAIFSIVFSLSVAALVGGCASASGVHELLPSANYMSSSQGNGSVDVFRQGESPSRPYVRIAAVAAHGNAYADQATLERVLVQEAQKVGADCVTITGKEISKDEGVGTYGGGIMMSSQIQRPHLYGIACRYSKVRLGISWDKEGFITYVSSGSAADRAGLVEGQRLAAINGVPFSYGGYFMEKEVVSKSPGDVVVLEVLSRNSEKIRKEVVLEAWSR